MKLSFYAHGRNNNFNLLRLLAALAVLFSHSYVVATGDGKTEPLFDSLGVTWGYIAVDVFFITSGFLVTSSLLTRKRTIEFVISRLLRIYPALFLMVFVSVFLLGITFTSLPVGKFLQNEMTHIFVLKNTTLIFGVTGTLPGVFESIPYPKAVNVSLWTLPFEIRMYGILAIIWLVFFTLGRIREKAFASIVMMIAVGTLLIHSRDYIFVKEVDNFHRLLFMFFSGGAYYVLKDRVFLSSNVSLILFLFVVLSAMISKDMFFVAYHCSIAYLVLWVAYVPQGVIRQFNRVGDYSYGIYIYAFPVQQSVVAFVPGASIWQVMFISTIGTFVFACLSWHLVEKRALKLKSALEGSLKGAK